MENPQINQLVGGTSARRLLLFGGLPLAAVAVAVLAMHSPQLTLAGLAVVTAACLLVARPDAATVLVAFLLYSNAAAIAVNFHGVPFVVGAAVPLLLGLPLCQSLLIRRERVILTPIVPLFLLFETVKLVSVLVAERPDESIAFMVTSVTEGLGIYLVLTNAIRTQETVRRAMWGVIAAAAFLGGLTLYQDATKTYNRNYGGFAQNENNAAFKTDVHGREVVQPRLEGPIGDPNFYAQMLLMVWPLALFRTFHERRLSVRIIAAAAAALIAAGIALTFSRGAMLGGAAIIGVMCLLRYVRAWHLGLVGAGLVLLLALVPEYRTRFESLQRLAAVATGEGGGLAAADRSAQSRLTEMMAAGLVFLEHPALGVGPAMFKHHYLEYADRAGLRVQGSERAAHNTYLQIAAESGAVALVCFLGMLAVQLRGLHRVIRTSRDRQRVSLATALFLALVGFMVTSQFLGYAYIIFFWMIMALAGALTSLPEPDGPEFSASTNRVPVNSE